MYEWDPYRRPCAGNGVEENGMYAIAILRYRKPLEEVEKHTDAHRATNVFLD